MLWIFVRSIVLMVFTCIQRHSICQFCLMNKRAIMCQEYKITVLFFFNWNWNQSKHVHHYGYQYAMLIAMPLFWTGCFIWMESFQSDSIHSLTLCLSLLNVSVHANQIFFLYHATTTPLPLLLWLICYIAFPNACPHFN